jgi:hypothetical protein
MAYFWITIHATESRQGDVSLRKAPIATSVHVIVMRAIAGTARDVGGRFSKMLRRIQ